MASRTRVSIVGILSLVGACLSSACTDRFAGEGPPITTEVSYPVKRRAVDLLFVLTVGNSTFELREAVGQAFPDLYEALQAQAGPDLSLHIGATSTEMGAGPFQPADCVPRAGKLYVPPPDQAEYPRPTGSFINVEENKHNVEGGVSDPGREIFRAFEGMTWVGGWGCSPFGVVQPLEAARAALLPETNPGFVRQDALLFVLYVADTLDCSLARPELFAPATRDPYFNDPSGKLGPYSAFRCFEFGFDCDIDDRTIAGPRQDCQPRDEDGWLHPLSRYVAAYHQLKRPGEVVLAAIAGPPEPVEVKIIPSENPSYPDHPILATSATCFEVGAQPALRLHGLLSRFPPLLFASKCTAQLYNPDYRSFLRQLGSVIAERLGQFCLSAAPSAAAKLAGSSTREACELQVLDGAGERSLPVCAAAGTGEPCWLPTSLPACSRSAGLGFTLQHADGLQGRLRLRCSWSNPR